MKIITRAVLDWETGNVLEEDSFEYQGPLAHAKDSGSSPTPVDPYAQAAAQQGLAENTANYNAALNRTSSSNPLGSSSWSVNGTDGTPASASTGSLYGLGGANSGSQTISLPGGGSYTLPGTASSAPATPATNGGSGAPLYSQQTSLTPWANQMLASPIDTSSVPGAAGGPNVSQNDYAAQQANYNQQMAYLQPQQALATEQQTSQLANEGITPGSAAYTQAQGDLGRQQTFANQQAADSAIGAGNQEEATLYGLGSEGLQNQLAVRNAPISEYEQLQGNGSGGQISAATPDISGAFNQQYQGALAGYNANTATNNANTGAAAGVGAAALLAFY